MMKTPGTAAYRRAEAAMATIVTSSDHGTRRPLLAVAGVVGIMLAGTIVLWGYYGTAVFFEMIRAGFAACL
jgi:hypothetical protein